MKQGLQLSLGHQLKMTPQLQQAIKLLQLSTLDLQQEIQQNLYENPLLELDETAEAEEPPSAEALAEKEQREQQELEREFEYSNVEGVRKNQYEGAEFPDQEGVSTNSLRDHLEWQLNLSQMSDLDRAIGAVIIDSIGSDGFLSASLEELLDALKDDEAEEELDLDDIRAVLKRIQHFDPPGIGACDVRECLQIQLDLLDSNSEHMDLAKKIVAEYLPLLAKCDLATLAKRVRADETSVRHALGLIRSLNPKPGYSVSAEEPDYIVPDVVVSKQQGKWTVRLNGRSVPKIRLNQEYASLAQSSTNGETKEYLKANLQEARWFLRSLESRNDTLMRVANEIVRVQAGFFDHGPEAMKPLILKDLAETLELHESTISRATNQKFMLSPAGIFELKYFFSSQVSTSSGGECSSTAIRALIDKLISAEDQTKPLSDSKLTNLLQQEGIMVARRTVAKYREMLGIPSSSDRKRIAVN